MNLPARQTQPRFTWTDYRNWPDDERWEIIGGKAHAMAPAPTTSHQTAAGRVYSRFERHLAGKTCQPFISPIDVRLSEEDVVQPDVIVVCRPEQVTPSHIEGAPALVVEVLSPSTATRDLRDKKALYERAGVGEYLIVDPLERYAIRFLLGADGSYDKGTVFGADETLPVVTLDGFLLALREVFGVPETTTEAASPPSAGG